MHIIYAHQSCLILIMLIAMLWWDNLIIVLIVIMLIVLSSHRHTTSRASFAPSDKPTKAKIRHMYLCHVLIYVSSLLETKHVLAP